MILPDGTRSDDYNPNNWGGSACDKFKQLLLTNDRLKTFFEWLADEDGNLLATFLDELNRWEYGPMLSTSTGDGVYNLVSTPAYAAIRKSYGSRGRMVIYNAVVASPATGCVINLDGIGPLPLNNFNGLPIQLNEIRVNQTVIAINLGSEWRTMSQLSGAQTFVLPGQSFGSATAAGNVVGDFPAVMTITLTKPATSRWDFIDLSVHGMLVGSSDEGAQFECALVFNDGPSAASSVTTATGSGNIGQVHSVTISRDSTVPVWRQVFKMPAGYDAVNSVQFKATLTIGALYGDGPELSADETIVTERFFGVAHYLSPLS